MNLPQFVNIYKNWFYFLDDHSNLVDQQIHISIFLQLMPHFILQSSYRRIISFSTAAQQKEMFLQNPEILGLPFLNRGKQQMETWRYLKKNLQALITKQIQMLQNDILCG